MEQPVAHDGPAADNVTQHYCKNVWLLEYEVNKIQKKADLEKAAVNVTIGDTPQLSIVVFGREFEVNEHGPHWTVYGSDESRSKPVKQVFLGETHLDLVDFMEFYRKLIDIKGHFGSGSYDLFCNNSIHFAEALSIKLVGKRLPVQYQFVAEKKAMRVAAIAGGACDAVGCLCASAVASYKDHREKNFNRKSVHVEDDDNNDISDEED